MKIRIAIDIRVEIRIFAVIKGNLHMVCIDYPHTHILNKLFTDVSAFLTPSVHPMWMPRKLI